MTKELTNTINKILKNKEIINFLSKQDKENSGFLLGKIEYFDDINVLIMYGITLDKENKSKTKIFSYKLFPPSSNYDFKLGDFLPSIPEFTSYPNIEKINERFEGILKNPEKMLIDYSPFLREL